MRLIHPDTLAAVNALRTKSATVMYCDACDGLRIQAHICTCWQCGAPVKTDPNADCSICQLIRKHFLPEA